MARLAVKLSAAQDIPEGFVFGDIGETLVGLPVYQAGGALNSGDQQNDLLIAFDDGFCHNPGGLLAGAVGAIVVNPGGGQGERVGDCGRRGTGGWLKAGDCQGAAGRAGASAQ